MPEKYYQEYGPMRRRRTGGGPADEQIDLEPLLERPPLEPAPRRPGRARRRRSRWHGALRTLLVVGLVAAGLAGLPYAANLLAADQPIQGVTIQGQPVSGMPRAAIRAELEQRYGPFAQAPLTLVFQGQSWTPAPEQIGVRLDLDRTVDDAVAAGRQGGPVERAQALWALWQRGGVDIAPRLTIDMSALQAYLNSLAGQVEQPPRDAALSLAAGKVVPTPSRLGRQVLVDETAREIVQSLVALEPRTITLRTRNLAPTIDDTQLARAADEARELLDEPLTLEQGDRSWTWEPDRIAELLAVNTADGHMSVAVDPARLERAVEKLAQFVDSGSVEPRAAFQNGQARIVEPGQVGLRLNQPDAAQAISATLRLSQRSLALPVEELTPQVTPANLAELGIVELVGEGRTSFAGSAAYRITNIKAGAARMDGVLIPPDAEFSFNTQLGAVDESNGFVQGYAVIGDRTQLEWGGGVCQDSTTLFRAAFWAGLPITERHAHPFYISWYDDYSFPGGGGPGMDATIFTGAQDLKFVNDTGKWLLLEAIVDEAGQTLTVRLYGTKPNRTVSLIGPQVENVVQPPGQPRYVNDASLPAGTLKQTDTARQGMDIAVYRVITENGQQREPELFFTRFKAWPNVFVRGTGQ